MGLNYFITFCHVRFHVLCMRSSLFSCHLFLAEAVNAQTRSDTGTTGSVESPNWIDLRPAANDSVECHSPPVLTGMMNICDVALFECRGRSLLSFSLYRVVQQLDNNPLSHLLWNPLSHPRYLKHTCYGSSAGWWTDTVAALLPSW